MGPPRWGSKYTYIHNYQWYSWNPKQPFINGCFNWMIPNLYIGNGCFTKHQFFNGCLGFQVYLVKLQRTKIATWALKRELRFREIPLFQGNLSWWNIVIWPDNTIDLELYFINDIKCLIYDIYIFIIKNLQHMVCDIHNIDIICTIMDVYLTAYKYYNRIQ